MQSLDLDKDNIVDVGELEQFLTRFASTKQSWELSSWLPFSTYLYFEIYLCPITKLKEHSREICYPSTHIFLLVVDIFLSRREVAQPGGGPGSAEPL